MRLFIALGVGLISFSSAFAASQADRETCDKASDPDAGIKACTNIIDSYDKGYNRAIAYNIRGNDYWRKGEYDRAIADFDQAIRLDPQDAA
ncbi:MAG: tetratricopeptide repeat protein, partial [Rhodomicrobium sp.]